MTAHQAAQTAPADQIDWKLRIVELVFVKQRVDQLDPQHLWEYRLPHVAATEGELRAVEVHLGEPLDPYYRGFLSFAGGWPAFFQTVDLLGPGDLLDGPRLRRATMLLSDIEDTILAAGGLRREELLPIAASSEEVDLFVMTRRSAAQPGQVIWFAEQEIDRYPNFHEYFLAMTAYNCREIELIGRQRRE